jgi:hypothetical protein
MSLDKIQTWMGTARIQQMGYRNLPLIQWNTYLTVNEIMKQTDRFSGKAIPWEEVFVLAQEVLDE